MTLFPHPEAPLSRLFFCDCAFDPEARELLRDGSSVELSSRTFQALKILIDARPRAVSHDDLYDALWPDTVVEAANLHNIIHALRSALGDSSRTIIRTVFGYGFAFAAQVAVAEPDPDQATSRFELEVGGATIPISKGIHVIGRDFDSLIPTTQPAISRRHARIIVTETCATIEDLGSRNGTLVAGQRIAVPTLLQNGDAIVFGDVLAAIFRVIPQPGPTASAETKKEFVRTS